MSKFPSQISSRSSLVFNPGDALTRIVAVCAFQLYAGTIADAGDIPEGNDTPAVRACTDRRWGRGLQAARHAAKGLCLV